MDVLPGSPPSQQSPSDSSSDAQPYRLISELVSDFVYGIRVADDRSFVLEWETSSLSDTSVLDLKNGWQPGPDGLTHSIYPSDLPLIQRFMERLLTNRPGVAEYRIVNPDGNVRWISNHARPVWDKSQERITYIYGAVQDITERKTSEFNAQQVTLVLLQRVEELSMLNRIARTLAAALDLPQALEIVGNTILSTFHASFARICLLDAQSHELTVLSRVASLGKLVPARPEVFSLAAEPVAQKVVSRGQASIVTQTPITPMLAEDWSSAEDEGRSSQPGDSALRPPSHALNTIPCLMMVPLHVRGAVTGIISVESNSADRVFTPADVALVQTITGFIASAIENAERYEQVHIVAADEERGKLARDLHDSVSQALFSANLIADVMPQLWETDRDAANEGLASLRQLTRGALAEMRTLLLELRPNALAQVRLNTALEQLTEAITAQTLARVATRIDPVPLLPPEAQVGLYRVAQEALHNIVKHANAKSVEVALVATPHLSTGSEHKWRGEILIRIADDGRGFDSSDVSPEHLGLAIMRERAAAVGASLQIDSMPGGGTQVALIWRGTAASVAGRRNER